MANQMERVKWNTKNLLLCKTHMALIHKNLNKRYIGEIFKLVKEKDMGECIGKMEPISLECGQTIKE